MYNKIKLAKFIHRFETDLDYRNYLSESYPDKSIVKLSHYIACNSIDWVYFPKNESLKYSKILDKAYKVTPDDFLCVEMVEILNIDIDDTYAELILNTANDIELTDDYITLMNLLDKKKN